MTYMEQVKMTFAFFGLLVYIFGYLGILFGILYKSLNLNQWYLKLIGILITLIIFAFTLPLLDDGATAIRGWIYS